MGEVSVLIDGMFGKYVKRNMQRVESKQALNIDRKIMGLHLSLGILDWIFPSHRLCTSIFMIDVVQFVFDLKNL